MEAEKWVLEGKRDKVDGEYGFKGKRDKMEGEMGVNVEMDNGNGGWGNTNWEWLKEER